MRSALDENHLAAKATNGLRHLYADRPTSEYEQPTGDGLHAGRLTVRPDALEAAQARHGRDDRLGTCRQDHVSRRVANAVDVDRARSGQPPATAKQVDAMLGEPTLLAGVGIVRDHVITPGKGRPDVDLRCRRRVVRAVHGLPRAQQRLGRNARPVGALATDQFALHNCDAQPALRERAGAVLARRAAADDDDVVAAGHDGSGLPACSATM